MSIRFDGTTERLHVTGTLPSRTAFTLCGWAKCASFAGAYRGLAQLSASTASPSAAYELGWSSANVLMVSNYYGGGDQSINFSATPAAGEWFFFALTGSATAVVGYVGRTTDAALLTASNDLVISFTPGVLGLGDNGWSEGFNGNIAGIRVWDATLTAAELEQERWSLMPRRLANLNRWSPVIGAGVADCQNDLAQNLDWTATGTLSIEDGPPVGYGAPALILSSAASSGQTVALGQASENDSAQALTRRKTRAIAQPSEADTAQGAAHAKRLAIGQATESGSAQPIAARKQRAAAQAVESDTAQPASAASSKVVSAAQALESDTAQPAARAKRLSPGQSTEADSAQSLARRKARAIAQPAEADTAQGAAHAKRLVLGQAIESESAQALTRRKARAVAQVLEAASAQLVTATGSKILALGQAQQADTAAPAVWAPKRRRLATSAQSDAAQTFAHRKSRAAAQAIESDTAQALTRRKARAMAQPAEADTAQTVSLPGEQVVAVGPALENDTAQAFAHAKRKSLGQAAQADTARPVAANPIARQLGLVLEIDLAQPLAWAPKRRQAAQAGEFDQALAIAVWQPAPWSGTPSAARRMTVAAERRRLPLHAERRRYPAAPEDRTLKP